MQHSSNKEIKLIYVHEGKKFRSKGRYELINKRYFTGSLIDSEDLWLEVADYLEEAYDMESVENIYLSGDGASRIKEGLNWIKGSRYVLDSLNFIIEETESETKKEAVRKSKKYILNNWDGIIRRFEDEYIECSAEGHISHILSSRLSSRPLG